MGAAFGGLMWVVQILQVFCLYGMLAAIAYMLYKMWKEIADIKRSITDLQETITLMRLPREADRDKAPQP
jgi:hypothetical protein